MFENHPLRDLNTWRVGGSCSFFAAPGSETEARQLIERGAKERKRIYILGGGSNILIQDGILDALVIHTAKLDAMETEDGGGRLKLRLGAGVSVKRLFEFAFRDGWGDLEFLAGIPGTVGGAIWGNAGAAGVSFAGLVESIDTLGPEGPKRWRHDELCWEYRRCPLRSNAQKMISGATLVLERRAKEEIVEKIRAFSNLKKRQPIGAKTAGCVFKNPAGASAGKLIDQAGCKGLRVGGAVVSSRHANFIENLGGASAQDIFTLSETCREMVFAKTGIELEYEIQFFGDFKKTF